MENRNPGKIYVGGHKRGVKYPSRNAVTTIPAWSRGSAEWKGLSPMIIGPVLYTEDGKECRAERFENFWQGHKVWEIMQGKILHYNKLTDNVLAAWYQWRNSMMYIDTAFRRPNGHEIPVFALFDGQRMGLVESRHKLYKFYYQQLIRDHPSYQKLLRKVQSGTSVLIVEPDGPCPILFPNGVEMSKDILAQLEQCEDLFTMLYIFGIEKANEFIEEKGVAGDDNAITSIDEYLCKYTPFGHGYVIALTLLEDIAAQ